ncbi:hypothetical protein [uncultured Vibrio sp.]|uniref:YciI family protein n=1 Tax=uncultured Vibrio sp. TaxID=114054 RepID=UPI0025F617BC|nr:hypothetical protein [uncultured Vibrio sp.]
MFIIQLQFSTNKGQAKELMSAHQEWIAQGVSDNVFLVVGNLEPNRGGAIMAHNATSEEIHERVNNDPFVIHHVVSAEVIEITPKITDKRLDFLIEA